MSSSLRNLKKKIGKNSIKTLSVMLNINKIYEEEIG